MLNPIKTAAIASKLWIPPIIKTIAYKDKEIICLYIDAWIGEQKINKTLIELGVVIELIIRKVV